MFNEKNSSILEIIEQRAEADAKVLLSKNKFILNILNSIGSFLDKNFDKIKEFNIEANVDVLQTFHEYFFDKCKNSEEMWTSLDIIFSLIRKYEYLDENKENLITELMSIFSEKKFTKNEKVSFMEKLLKNNLKLCLKKEQYEFLTGYNQLFLLELSEFLDILFFIISDDNDQHLTKLVLEVLRKNFQNVIIPESLIETLNFEPGNSCKYLNQLIRLNLEVDEQHVLFFENSLFKLRRSSIDECLEYINESSKKKTSKSKKAKKKNKKEEQKNKEGEEKNKEGEEKNKEGEEKNKKEVSKNEEGNAKNIPINNKASQDITNDQIFNDLNIDINNIVDPIQKYLLSKIEKLNHKLEELNQVKSELAETKDKLSIINEESAAAKKESAAAKKESEAAKKESAAAKKESAETKTELEKVKKANMSMQVKISNLELDLKKIKIRSIFKGIIDIFASVFNIELNDYYYIKLEKILDTLGKYKKNEAINELSIFLQNIYYYLHKGNLLAHSIDENLTPLELIFQIVESDKKKCYPIVKQIFNNLSLNEPLKYAVNNYYSFKDQNRILKNIRFSLEELEDELS